MYTIPPCDCIDNHIPRVTGGELFDKIVENEFYSEKDAADLIYQIASVVSYLHKKGIVHRDLKPENLLLEDESAAKLKLCDFGLADKFKVGEKMRCIVGSPTYMAPEILEGTGYDNSVDLYSIGVIMYILLCGYPPFEPEEGIIELEFPSPEWDTISSDVKEIITKLLDNDGSKRLTAEQLLNHPWVSGDKASKKALTGTIRTMSVYNTVRRNPGATMRQKDRDGKTHVGSIFSNNMISPRSSNINSMASKAPKVSLPPDYNGKKPSSKSKKRKSQAPKPRDPKDNNLGDKSLQELSKKAAELGEAGVKNSPRPSDKENALKERELVKLKELYQSEKSKRLECEDEVVALEKSLEEESSKAKELKQQLEVKRVEFETLENEKKQKTQLKRSILDDKITLEVDQRKVNIEFREVDSLHKKLNRRVQELEDERTAMSESIIDVLQTLNSSALKVDVDKIVHDRLQKDSIKSIEEERDNLWIELQKMNDLRDAESMEVDSLKSLNKKWEKELDELKKLLLKETEEKALAQCEIDKLSVDSK